MSPQINSKKILLVQKSALSKNYSYENLTKIMKRLTCKMVFQIIRNCFNTLHKTIPDELET